MLRSRASSSSEGESERPPKRQRHSKGTGRLPDALSWQDDDTLNEGDHFTPLSVVPVTSGSPLIILHRVGCTTGKTPEEDHSDHPPVAFYHDQPRLFAKDTRASCLRGASRLSDINTFLSENEQYSIVVYKHYNCDAYHHKLRKDFVCTAPENIDKVTFERLKPWFHVLGEDGSLAWASSEEIVVLDDSLLRTFETLIAQDAEVDECYDDRASLRAPYDFFYHFSDRLKRILLDQLPQTSHHESLKVLLEYIESTCERAWHRCTQLFEQQIISPQNFSKLFHLGNTIIHEHDEMVEAYHVEEIDFPRDRALRLKCWTLAFDGSFQRKYKTFSIATPTGQVSMRSLTIWPLRLDSTGLRKRLKERGGQFWRCRSKRLVSYRAPQLTNFELQTGDHKYMVDIETHRTLHPKSYPDYPTQDYENIDMAAEKPPEGNLLYLMPATVPGFGFHDKKWRNLQVDYVDNVAWNEHAFKRLVLKANKKELIQALVTIHLENHQATDVIEGKGAGLIMLLHGPPGTGKTLTAETVSELANKPLYRVTCGDIGTDAESVEKYLESSLYLGTIWDCVVLLDEADVFLEERTQTDLARNALVSVFLRVLEYFNGILILTSNRVGLFDEAFKSRMQLAIRYPPLDEEGRFKIWDNFFNALKKAEVDMEYDDLTSNVKSLARKELNGRQIRNIIKTARQLAAFRKKRFGNEHLECAIEVVEEFEKYLVDTRGPDDYYARQQRLRYE